MTAKGILLRALSYVGIALAVLVLVGLSVILSAKTGLQIPIRWLALPVFTAIVIRFVFQQCRHYAKRRYFWPATVTMLLIHISHLHISPPVHPAMAANLVCTGNRP
jgi:hypothetical protein